MSKAAPKPAEPKVGYVRYLQITDQTQNHAVVALLRVFHAKEIHTVSEWDEIVKMEMEKKVY